MSEKCALIEAEKAHYNVVWMCRLLNVARSSFYAWQGRAESATVTRRRELTVQVQRVFGEHEGRFGCRRVTAQLNREGVACSVGLVADLMRERRLRAVQPRGFKVTTVPGEEPVEPPDLIDRDFDPASSPPGQRLVGDITYLQTGQGWLYLATVIDLATRMVVGWQMADHMRTTLVTEALQMALDSAQVTDGAIFHSDRGAQYTSKEFARFCSERGIEPSVGQTGVCWDNAVAESFFATLKNEMFHRQHWPTRARARFAVASYIEVYYNRRRLHSSLGYRTPHEAFTDHTNPTTAATAA